MSVTMTKTDQVTVLTLTSDPQSDSPPICQLCKSLCYSPMCCSVSRQLKKIQGTPQSALGKMQIIIGFQNIGLGAVLLNAGGASWEIRDSMFPFWFGGLFILFGAMNILSERCQSSCLVFLNVIVSVVGVAFAIAAIVLYSNEFRDIWLWWNCQRYDQYYKYRQYTTPAPSPVERMRRGKCLEVQELTQIFFKCIHAGLIFLSVLQLCASISSVVLGIKTLCCSKKREKCPVDL